MLEGSSPFSLPSFPYSIPSASHILPTLRVCSSAIPGRAAKLPFVIETVNKYHLLNVLTEIYICYLPFPFPFSILLPILLSLSLPRNPVNYKLHSRNCFLCLHDGAKKSHFTEWHTLPGIFHNFISLLPPLYLILVLLPFPSYLTVYLIVVSVKHSKLQRVKAEPGHQLAFCPEDQKVQFHCFTDIGSAHCMYMYIL